MLCTKRPARTSANFPYIVSIIFNFHSWTAVVFLNYLKNASSPDIKRSPDVSAVTAINAAPVL